MCTGKYVKFSPNAHFRDASDFIVIGCISCIILTQKKSSTLQNILNFTLRITYMAWKHVAYHDMVML